MRPTTIDIRRSLLRALRGAFTVPTIGLVGWLVASLGFGAASAQDVLFPAVRVTQEIEGDFGEDELGPQSLALADVDGDGQLDLIVIFQVDGEIGVALGSEDDGIFEDMQTFEVFVTPSSVKVADVASPFGSDAGGGPDGNPDIIVGDLDGSAEILLGDGDGDFDGEEAPDLEDLVDGDEIVGVAVGNFDANPDLDLAFLDTNVDETKVFFLCNGGNGTFTPCTTPELTVDGSIPVDIAVAALDTISGDDIVVLNQNENDDPGTVSLLFGDGQGSFGDVRTQPAEADPSNVVQSLAVGRLNSDVLDDFVVGSADNGSSDRSIVVGLMQGNRTASIAAQTGTFADIVAIGIADATGNGSQDVIIASVPISGDSSLGPVILNGTGTGSFILSLEPFVNGEDIGPGRAIALGDLGGSALFDIVQLSGDGQLIRVALNEPGMGTPTATMPGGGASPTPTPTGPAGPTDTPTVPLPTNTATATPTPTRVPIAYGQCNLQVRGALAGVATGQFDSDASPDIAVTDPTNNKVYVIFNTSAVQGDIRDCAREMFTPAADPTPIVVPTIEEDVSGAPDAIASVTLDSDRDVDLVVATDNGIQTLINDGGGFSAGPLLVGPSNSQPVALAVDSPMDPSGSGARRRLDLNADGLTDVVAVNAGSTRLSMFLQRTDGGFTVNDTLDLFRAANSIAAADFTQDNNVDFVVGAGREALFLRRNGNDTGGLPAFVLSNFGRDDGGNIVAVTSGFFNGDQMPDVLVTRQEGLAQVYLFGGIAFTLAGQYATRPGQTAAGIGLFNAMDSNSDAVVASRLPVPALNFGLGDGAGMFRGALDPLSLRAAPVALSVVNIDSEGAQDVVTANSDGTVSVLLSSVPPPTPTPLPTDTPPPSPTPTITATAVNTPTPTASPSQTALESPTRTATFTPVNTPKDGTFELSGSGCSIDETGRRVPIEAVALTLLLAGLRWSRRRAAAISASGRK